MPQRHGRFKVTDLATSRRPLEQDKMFGDSEVQLHERVKDLSSATIESIYPWF